VVPKGFFPTQDTGVVLGISQASPATSFLAMEETQRTLGRVVLEDPAVQGISSFIGVDGINTTVNSGRILIALKPENQRHESVVDIIRRLRQKVSTVTGARLYLQPVQDLTVDAQVSRTQYQLTLEDPDARELQAWWPRAMQSLADLHELREVNSDQQNDGL